jgi:S1-C subfamily serine protease
MVLRVDANRPDAAAGMRQGDVIVAGDGEAIQSVWALLRSLGPDSVGGTIRLGLRRASEPMEVNSRSVRVPKVDRKGMLYYPS